VLFRSPRRLVEPLCGGLAVALGLRPELALLNDINVHAINFFLWLKKGFIITIPMKNESKAFYTHRQRLNELIKGGKADSKEAAELFYYLNRTCYNGLCRFNRSGEFNVPFGRHKRINYIRDFSTYKEVFRKWEFMVGDFENVPLEPDDFVYADPPYDVEFRQYSKEGFTWDDQVRLAKWLVNHPGPVVLSNQATPRIRTLYSELGFKLRFLQAPRMISCKGNERKPATEVVAVKGI
jgi:DNA adenine methylase